jgi:hypothetical protein
MIPDFPARAHLLAEAWRSAHSSLPAGNRCVRILP